MSRIREASLRALVALQTRTASDERGQSTAEYGIVILIAIALGTAVLMLFTGGKMDGALTGLLSKVLTTATGMVKN